jgi:uncharacterized membrane protein YoaK (UPF0700 family)
VNDARDFPLAIRLLLLSLAAGCVDAIAFIDAGVFPANMTGNSVVLAIAISHGGGAALAGIAFGGFCAGAAMGSWLVAAPRPGWSSRISMALALGAALVLASAGVIALSGGRFLPGLVAATSAAMGLQSAAVQQVGVSGVSTVFVTGTLTTGISRLVRKIRGPMSDLPPARETPWLPLLTWAAYFGGAVLGGLNHRLSGGVAIALPGLLLVVVVILAERTRQRAGK